MESVRVTMMWTKRAVFLLPLLLGGALWGVNWRLDHPPLSRSDRELATSFDLAQTADVFQQSCQQQACAANAYRKIGSLSALQTQRLRELLRVQNGSFGMYGAGTVLDIRLINKRRAVDLIQLCQTGQRTVVWDSMYRCSWYLHPRFEGRLRSFLDANLPQRLQP